MKIFIVTTYDLTSYATDKRVEICGVFANKEAADEDCKKNQSQLNSCLEYDVQEWDINAN